MYGYVSAPARICGVARRFHAAAQNGTHERTINGDFAEGNRKALTMGGRQLLFKARLMAVMSCVVALVCVLVGPLAAASAAPVDATLTMDMVYATGGQTLTIPGVTATVYQVASLNDGINHYTLLDAFASLDANFDAELDATQVDEYAQQAASIVEAAGMQGTSVTSGEDGQASFGTLPWGIYLVVQTDATGDAEGYKKFDPFLVAVPQVLEDEIIYDVVCYPKLLPTGKVPPNPDEPDEPTKPTPDTPTNPKTPSSSSSRTPSSSSSLARTGDETNSALLFAIAGVGTALLLAGGKARGFKSNER